MQSSIWNIYLNETRLKVDLALDHELTKINKTINVIKAIKAIKAIIKTIRANKIKQR